MRLEIRRYYGILSAGLITGKIQFQHEFNSEAVHVDNLLEPSRYIKTNEFRLKIGKLHDTSIEEPSSISNTVTLNKFSFRGEEIIVSIDYENPKSRLKSNLRCKITDETKHPPYIYTIPIRHEEEYQGEAGIAGLVRKIYLLIFGISN
ncbi:Oidioi.mRNA.OKI2018_I69.chr1.g697.t1.cds [Oikopleura dioica]|uniref:Oidioi.mRNA.OKI2018_I69.chr1.g697.t1.cds n=1 Tax=Oikopleura dioica TaxID=34765 RepID=A0ABN7SUW3_OIKDI|nr:Oidioi.mRNA.OKI2018_I69.chr1.g697.t1.cds [Oikopleura dioica]